MSIVIKEDGEGNYVSLMGVGEYGLLELATKSYRRLGELLPNSGLLIEGNMSTLDEDVLVIMIKGTITDEELYKAFRKELYSL